MKQIRNYYWTNKKWMNTFLRFVNKETGEYVDVMLPGGTSGEERKAIAVNPGLFSGEINAFDNAKHFDYYFLFRNLGDGTFGRDKHDKDGVGKGHMCIEIKKGEMVIIDFDLDTNKPILTKEIIEYLGGLDINDFLNYEHIDKIGIDLNPLIR